MNLRVIAQKIVDATMEEIDNRNINIMDCNGFIIASGEKNRINTYHKGADDVIKSGQNIEIYPEQVPNYPGSKEGVNMPIHVLGKTLGVVGVYGNPDEVRIVAKLVKKSVELTVEHYLISEQVELVKDLKQQIIRKLIYDDIQESEEEILCLSNIVGIDLSKKRCAIVLELSNYSFEDSFQLLKTMNKIEYFLAHHSFADNDNFSAIINEYYVIFKSIPIQSAENEQQFLEKLKKDIYRECGCEVKIAMGSFHRGLSGYAKSFQEAKTLLKISDKPTQSIGDLDVQVDYLLNQIAPYELEHFIHSIYENILDNKGRLQLWIINTLKALFANNLNIIDAAKSLYIHKNTMLYRMKRIEEITGLSANSCFHHAILLKLLVIYVERLHKV